MKKTIKKTVTTVTEVVNTDEKTLIAAILDRSGSMSVIIEDAIGGFNEFLLNQKKLDDDASMTIALFDDRYDLIYNNYDLKTVAHLTRKEWSPRGSTSLYDAIGRTINTITDELNSLKKNDIPNKILVAIVTDGYENTSKEYTADMVKKLIKKKEKEDWQFVYLAADQNAFDVGTSLGFSGGNTFTYANTSDGNSTMFNSLSTATMKYRNIATTDSMYSTFSKNLFDGDENNLNVVDNQDAVNVTGNVIITSQGNITTTNIVNEEEN